MLTNQASVRCVGQTYLIHGGHTSHLTGFKGSVANIMVPYTKAELQGSNGVHVSTGQGFFTSKGGINTILVGHNIMADRCIVPILAINMLFG